MGPLVSGQLPFVLCTQHLSSLLVVVPHRCMSRGPHQGAEASKEGEIEKGEKESVAAWTESAAARWNRQPRDGISSTTAVINGAMGER
jgi:hypothetical protein